MKGVVVVDANLLVLLVVGAASTRFISRHKRLSAYAIEDFELLGLILADFDEIERQRWEPIVKASGFKVE